MKSFTVKHDRNNNVTHSVIDSVAFNKQKLVLSYKVYSIKQLLRFANDNLCCSACGVDDFIPKTDSCCWFNSYYIPPVYVQKNYLE